MNAVNSKTIATLDHEAKVVAIIQEIHDVYYCEMHKVANYVQCDGTYKKFMISQLIQWAKLIVNISAIFIFIS